MHWFENLFLNLLHDGNGAMKAVFAGGWTAWIALLVALFFCAGTIKALTMYVRAQKTIRNHIDAKRPSLEDVEKLAVSKGRAIPFILIAVPARDETAVIANTIRRLARLRYPTHRYAAVIITDKREKREGKQPTTHEMATRMARRLNSGLTDPWLYIVEVPEWYSGRFGSDAQTFARSTKGRALNYALQFLQHDKRLSQADMLSILDADGRLHPDVLIEVAHQRLLHEAKVLQGPVFQISNYRDVGLIGKAAGIELSVHHLSTLAFRLQRKRVTAEFLAGTNYFIDFQVMLELGGWDENALVEDAELGLRLYLKKNLKPRWLSCYEIEQTPQDRQTYLKQRERWALGHFRLLPVIRNSSLPLFSKIKLSARVLSAILASPLDIGLPVLSWVVLLFGWTQGLPAFMGWVMLGLLFGSLFVWDFFGRGYRMLEKYGSTVEKRWSARRLHELQFMLAMPWLMLVQAQPRLVAFYKYLTGSTNQSWVKTRRTIEKPMKWQPALAMQPARQLEPVSINAGRKPYRQEIKIIGSRKGKLLRSLVLAFLFVSLSLWNGPIAETQTNTAVPAAASLDWINLAAGRSYSLQLEPSRLYPDKGGMLTDGLRGPRENLERGSTLSAEGWVGFEHGDPLITVDLEQSYKVYKIRASFLNYPRGDINPPETIKLFTSFDGTHWIHRGSMGIADRSAFELDTAGWGARYVRLSVTRNKWAFFDEIEIFGVPSPYMAQSAPIKKTLVVTSDLAEGDERQLRLSNILDGMGIPFDTVETDQLDGIEFLDYQLLIFASSSKVQLNISESEERRIISAINSGTNVLWIGAGIWGSFKTTALADAFGLSYVKQGSNEGVGVRYAEFTNIAEQTERLPLLHETLWVVKPTGASAEGWYLDEAGNRLDIPFITRNKGNEHRGTAVYIALPILDRWKTTETPDTYGRAEILSKAVRSLLDDGLVAKHPVPHAKDAVFLLRLEDYTPGGLYMAHTTRTWLIRMERLLELANAHNIPLNIGVIPRYNHPFLPESHTWSDETPSIVQLRHLAERAFERGGNLIVHGFDHQNGEDVDDFSGDDWETWDEDAEVFLSLDEQKKITDSAFSEIEQTWGIKPTIWETPHYISNEDTFKAAHASGFLYYTESDTKIFPNRNGYLNRANGLMLNIPETGSFFPLDAAGIKEKTLIKQLHILPRITRLNAVFLVFYHNTTSPMHQALENFLMTVERYDLWKPNIEEYARFWEMRERVSVTSTIDRNANTIEAEVTDAFEGFTLAIQLPPGKTLPVVKIGETSVDVKTKQYGDTLILYIALEEGDHRVTVSYQ
jgi:cellulose synthase/poly-beta-1,6-N-acetylglucosamine synthase-like glycosyltransferase